MTARILVVDDEPDLEALVVQKFRRQIRDGDVSFVFAHDGIEALAVIAGDPHIDVVLCDINMPRMDGLTLLGKLQDLDERLSTVIVSAYGDMANIRTAMNRGAFDFLTKPIDFTDLDATLAKTLRYREVLRVARERQLAAERAQAALSRYFSPNLASRLAEDTVDLSGQRRNVAAMFTDVQGFTGLVESMDPAMLEELLRDYLSGMIEIVFAHEGTLAKIVGDALHILFGAPADQPDHATRAVKCALALDRFAEGFRRDWRERGISVGPTRIGLHSGQAIVGNFGGERFFDYTAYGDTINTAARLETANKALGTRICASAAIADQAVGFRCQPVGELLLRGRSDTLRALAPLTSEQCDDDRLRAYLDAYRRLENDDPGAVAAFAAYVGRWPEDALAGFHLKRLLNNERGTRIRLDM